MSSTDLDKILKRVRAIVTKAENLTADAEKPGVSDTDRLAYLAEADAARTMADALMLQYQITEVTAERESGTIQSKPMILTVNIGPDSEITGYFTYLMQEIAKHCRCRVRPYTSWTGDGWNAKVYGFESDVRYFDLLYTTIRLHMLGVLLPRVDRSESLEDNAYRLHNSGYNWLQIAEMYGWRKWQWRFSGGNGTAPEGMKVPYFRTGSDGVIEYQPATQVGSRIKRAYHRACAVRGESVQKIAANGTITYRKSAADGYVAMIARRLRKMASERDSGAALILRSRIDDLNALFRQDNPDLFPDPAAQAEEPSNAKGRKPRRVVYKTMRVNSEAYMRGARHAESADLNGSARMGGQREALGG